MIRKKLVKLKRCIRKLTVKGKVLVANTLFLSQLLYLGSCMYTPTWVADKYREITMTSKIEDTGLNNQDLECKVKSMKLNWIIKLANKEYNAPWKHFVAQHFTTQIENVVQAN